MIWFLFDTYEVIERRVRVCRKKDLEKFWMVNDLFGTRGPFLQHTLTPFLSPTSGVTQTTCFQGTVYIAYCILA